MPAVMIPHLQSLALSVRDPDLYELLVSNFEEDLAHKYSVIASGASRAYYKFDDFDSRHFGKKVVKVEHFVGTHRSELRAIILSLLELDADYFVFRVPQHLSEWIQAVEAQNGQFLDGSIHLSAQTKNLQAPSSETTVTVLPYDPEHETQVLEVAHAFMHGRFFTDPTFNNGSQVYAEWLRNSIDKKAAHEVYVALADQRVHAVGTLKYEVLSKTKKLLHIPLLAKHPKSSLSGLAGPLIAQARKVAEEKDFQAVLISTQSSNISALRAYIDAGFKPYQAELTLRIIANER